jgi:hypothetical protein
MILTIFTLFHVLISLLGIGSGVVLMYGFLSSRRLDGWTAIYLVSTAATSITGFLFPVQHFMPSHAVGILSLIVLAIAALARYRFQMAGGWKRTYVISSVIALYFNVFVLVVQMFGKIPALKELAPTQTEAPFKIAQLAVLLVFLTLGTLASSKFHDVPAVTASK